MNIFSTVKKNLFLSAIILVTAVFFVSSISSCSNNAPQLREASLTIIFDYDTEESVPSARLGVFVESVSNPRRFGTITVSAKGSDFIWESNNLVMAENEEQKFLGTVNLVMPQNKQFPVGEYDIEFIQYDEEKSEIKQVLTYDKGFYDSTTKDVPQLMRKLMGSKMLKVFDENNKILYYGVRTPELADARGIWNVYPNAKEFQETWVSASGNVICNLPVVPVTPGN